MGVERGVREQARRWPHRLALATLVAAIPLVVFGGTVTSLQAGMAIDGWLVVEPGRGDYFLLTYPVERWFRDVGTFVEHTHRLFGSLVGFLAIATVVATFVARLGAGARALSVTALLAVCAQGTLGGFRVLENSPELAFLHGAFGQAVFAVLAAQQVATSRRWRDTVPSACKHARPLERLSLAAVGVVYATVFLGAWLRHTQTLLGLVLHVAGVIASAALVLALASRLRAAAAARAEGGSDRSVLRGVRARLLALLATQVALGLAAFWIVFVAVGPDAHEVHQSILPTLHVLVGALLLAQTVAAAMWSRRVVCTAPVKSAALGQPSLGGIA